MARITEIYLIETPKQDAAVIHAKASPADIPAVIGEGFQKLEDYMQNEEITPSNSPFLKITFSDPAILDITIGMEVPQSIQGRGDISNYTIPAGKKIFCYWAGNNSDMTQLYEDMQEFAVNHGYTIQKGFYEYYLNNLEYGEDKLLTKVIMLLQ